MKCIECDKPAVWMRITQFSGEHPFCDDHARKEKNFGLQDSSYFFWKRLDPKVKKLTKKRSKR